MAEKSNTIGCIVKGAATFFLIIILTLLKEETQIPAIVRWGVGIPVLYAIWGRDWTGRKIEEDQNDSEPPTLRRD